MPDSEQVNQYITHRVSFNFRTPKIPHTRYEIMTTHIMLVT